MLTTTHYGLNIVEGADIVNPLVQQNPNYTAIDTAMYANKQAVIGTGTELTAGTVHTITRLNQDSNYVRFTATSNWTAGDSMVVDSTPVSVYLSDGTAPATGAYVINTEVLMIVNGSRATLITSAKDKDNQTAAQVSYVNTASGLSATNVQGAVDEINGKITKYAEISGTTTGSGALALPSRYSEAAGLTRVIAIQVISQIGFAIWRMDGYAQCFDASLNALANTLVTVRIFYQDV